MNTPKIKKTDFPDLVDGRDIFLRPGEVLYKTINKHTGEHLYVSNLGASERSHGHRFVKVFAKPEVPGERYMWTCPESNLQFID